VVGTVAPAVNYLVGMDALLMGGVEEVADFVWWRMLRIHCLNSPTASCRSAPLTRFGNGAGATGAARQSGCEADGKLIPQRGERVRDVALGSHGQLLAA
jgi:hypothetical protein